MVPVWFIFIAYPPPGATPVHQCMYFSLLPVTQLRYIFCNSAVSGPVLPDPMSRLSICPTGVTCAAVPVRNTSSAKYSSLRLILRCMTLMPSSFSASVITESLVIPSNAFAVSAGVCRLPPLSMNRFSPLPSDTDPSWFRSIAS